MAARESTRRRRMSSTERREQLISIGRGLFAERGMDAASVEEIATRAEVSKPVIYEHFGGKEGLYAVVVDREVSDLLERIRTALTAGRYRELLEQATAALLDYVDENPDGFRILVRDSAFASGSGSYASILSDIAGRVTDILAAEFKANKLDARHAPLYAQALVGMVALTGQWWLDVRRPRKPEVTAHLVNLAWNGLAHLEPRPTLLAGGSGQASQTRDSRHRES